MIDLLKLQKELGEFAERPLGICCNAPLEVEGDTTLHYVCTECGRPTDPKEIEE